MKPEEVLNTEPKDLTQTDCVALSSNKKIREQYEQKYGTTGRCKVYL